MTTTTQNNEKAAPAVQIPVADLRDYFAAKAMQVCLAQCTEFPDETWRTGVAMDAYLMADAMLKARAK